MGFRIKIEVVETDSKGHVEVEARLAQMSEEFDTRKKAVDCFHDLSAVQLSGAVVLHEGSTILVVLNALRLLRYDD